MDFPLLTSRSGISLHHYITILQSGILECLLICPCFPCTPLETIVTETFYILAKLNKSLWNKEVHDYLLHVRLLHCLQKLCAFYLATDYSGACGPGGFGDDNDKSELFIVRFQRNATFEALKAEKTNNLMEALQRQHTADASQLVARYKGPDEIEEVSILMIYWNMVYLFHLLLESCYVVQFNR